MARKLVRGFCTAAAAAVAAGSLVAGGPAVAQPAPGPAAPGPAADREAGSGAPGPGAEERSAPDLLADLQRLYRQAEAADAAYRAAQKKLQSRRTALGSLDSRLAKARRALHDSRIAAGRLARMQYQGSTELSPYLRLLLARDPQHALEQGEMIQRVSAARAAVVRRLADAERHAQRLTAAANRTMKAQQTLARRHQRQRDAAQARLRAVERLLAQGGQGRSTGRRSTGQRGAAPGRSPRIRAPRAPQVRIPGIAHGAPQSLLAKAMRSAHRPSPSGTRALQYAEQQVGKPYRWGATGPDAFDCSGLTSQAWAHAGHAIPRTSQAQWSRLPKVPMDRLRPGDLVIYYPNATHVALYVGDGMVVQAPRPGERVQVSPVRSNPVLGAVRPDQDEASL